MVSSTSRSAASARGADPRRQLPAVGELLARPELLALVQVYGRERVVVQAREELARLRAGEPEELAQGLERLADRVERALESAAGRPLRRVLNASGIFVHTNLGRAPLPASVADELAAGLGLACDLEIDLESGRRGDRNRRLERLLCLLTGAQAGVVVNNNAAALLLAVATLARGREVVVSRGELVEIGGSFRIPDVLEAAGGRLVEVGTTNRTRLDDYRRAIGPETGLVLKVEPSNYRIVGFTESVAAPALAGLAHETGVPLLVDEGSGLLAPHSAPQLASHPSHRELVAAGCDLVCGSGDKVLGGPQAGLLVGRQDLVRRARRHPMFRALRPGRAVIAALEAVLRLHLAGAPMPLERLWPAAEEHAARVDRAARALTAQGVRAAVLEAEAFVGGGAAPEDGIPGPAIGVEGHGDLLTRLRGGEPAVLAYARDGRVVLDLRTVSPEHDDVLVGCVVEAIRGDGSDRAR